MPFVVSTSKAATAVFGVITGNFLGDGKPMVILNKLGTISLFSKKRAMADKQPLEHVADFHVFATLKFLVPLNFVDSKGHGRHAVFLLSVKQEVSVVAFKMSKMGQVEMITLFHGDVNTCFYQQRPSEMLICSSSVCLTLGGDTLPFVAFSLHRGGVYFFDATAAISSYKPASSSLSLSTLETLFSRDFVQNTLKKSKRRTLFTYGHFDSSELNVRDIVLDYPDNEKGSVSLYVLFTDHSIKTHVSEYVVELKRNDDVKRTPRVGTRPWIPDSQEVFSSENIFRRKCVLLGNVETNASLLHVVPEGLFIIGHQLISFFPLSRQSAQQSGKHVSTVELPLSSVYVEPVCCTSLPNQELFVVFGDGTCVIVSIRLESEGSISLKPTLTCSIFSSARSIPDSVAYFEGYCVVGSRMSNSVWLHLSSGENGVLVNNCGPVTDITVAADGPRMSVIASTGVGLGGGLNLVRSAVNVHQDTSISSLPDVKRICLAENIMIIAFPGYSRVCVSNFNDESIEIRELLHTPFDTTLETLALICNQKKDTFYQVTTLGLRTIKGNGDGEYVIKDPNLGHAHTLAGLLIFSQSKTVYVLNPDISSHPCTVQFKSEVSCLAVGSSKRFFVGEWDSCAIHLCDVHQNEVIIGLKVQCSSTPCSICLLPHLQKPRLLAGLLNGNILEVSLENFSSSHGLKETFLMMQPVELLDLESHNAVLCLGEVPLIVIISDLGFQLTGIDFNDVAACAIIQRSAQGTKYVFFSNNEKSLVFGEIIDLQKLNMTFLGMKSTVTRVKYVHWWNVFALSVRRNEKDHVFLVMGHEISTPLVTRSEQTSLELLENERCVFLETMILGGPNNGEDVKDIPTNMTKALLIGTTFAFPDEQFSRSSRFMWCSVEGRSSVEKPQLKQLGGKDIDGALQCCCFVPNYAGRIALGINGCVSLYNWNNVDCTFISEETVRIGTIVTRLVPICHQDLSYIVAFDARHSCFFLQVDTIQGSLKIKARDPEIRGVMDGTAYESKDGYNIFFADDSFNLFSVSRNFSLLHSSPDNAIASNTSSGSRKLVTDAQYHLGDLVTSLYLGSFAPCSVTNEVVPVPNRLIPGVCGPQIVFGTSNGAFGTITPVVSETYIFLKSIEVATTMTISPAGGFDHASYREVLCAGQERGLSRNASFETVNSEAADVFSQRRKKFLPKCVCNGDLIESFLTFSSPTQEEIVRKAEYLLKKWYLDGGSTLIGFLEHADLEPSYHNKNAIQDTRVMPTNGLNSLFNPLSLPLLPLTVTAVTSVLHNLQRIH